VRSHVKGNPRLACSCRQLTPSKDRATDKTGVFARPATAHMNMYGRNISPQVASISQATPVLHQCLRTCRHRKHFGVRAAVATPEPILKEQKIPSPSDPVPPNLNKISRHITQPKSQGASQAMLYATGLTEEDMNKPQASKQ